MKKNGYGTMARRHHQVTQCNTQTRILRVLHIAIHCPLPIANIRGPKILEVSPCSDYILNYKFKGQNSGKNNSKRQNFEFYLNLIRYSYKSVNIDSIISQITSKNSLD